MKAAARILLSFLILCEWLPAEAQSLTELEDLRNKWMVVEEDGVWKDYDNRNHRPSTLYITIDPLDYSGTRLSVTGVRPFSIWINGKLLAEVPGAAISMDVDSLSSMMPGTLTLGIHAERGVEYVKTAVLASVQSHEASADELRRKNYLLDFSLLAFFTLAAYFIILVRSNPRLTLDHFNIARLVSAQERDESVVLGRITSSFNILVYLFIILWASFLVLIIAHFAGTLWIIVGDTSIHGLTDAFLKWGRISVILLVAVFAKMVLVLLLSRIFNMKEGASIQVLNFFRLLGALVMILSVILVFYFMFETISQQYYFNLITLVTWIFGLWAILIFIKLLNKSPFTLFHLISYLCASEFFPIIIVLRVLFF